VQPAEQPGRALPPTEKKRKSCTKYHDFEKITGGDDQDAGMKAAAASKPPAEARTSFFFVFPQEPAVPPPVQRKSCIPGGFQPSDTKEVVSAIYIAQPSARARQE
jgi:hypothetical protein